VGILGAGRPAYDDTVDTIDVTRPSADELRFVVTVTPDGGTATEHTVTVSDRTLEILGAGYPDPEAFIRACFRFLLEHEPNTSILASFDVDVIERYFPGFPEKIRRR